MSGWADIDAIAEELEGAAFAPLWVVPLHGSLDGQRQRDAFRAPDAAGTWKVVLATNVAETSITIPDVSFVVDAGLEKVVKFDDHLGASVLRGDGGIRGIRQR